jgi:hypothetical protein
MANRGQATTEFLLMLALLTGIGVFLTVRLIGPGGNGGAVKAAATSSVNSIAQDERGR